VLHELHHNWGLGHASAVNSYTGAFAEYGDAGDLMGSRTGSYTETAQLLDTHTGYKHGLSWIPDTHVLALVPPLSGATPEFTQLTAPGASSPGSYAVVLPYAGVATSAIRGVRYAPGLPPVATLAADVPSDAVALVSALSLASVTFRLRSSDGDGLLPAFTSTPLSTGAQLPVAFLAFRLPSPASIAQAPTGDRYVYGSLRQHLPYASNGITLADTPTALGMVGASLVVDTTPLSAAGWGDADVEPGQAYVSAVGGSGTGGLLVENLGWATDPARGGGVVVSTDTLVVRASFLGADGETPTGPGCTGAGCRRTVGDAAAPLACGAGVLTQLTAAADVALFVVNTTAVLAAAAGPGGAPRPVRLAFDTCAGSGAPAGSVTATALGVFVGAFPLAEWHTASPPNRSAPVPGVYAVTTTGAGGAAVVAACAQAEMVLPPRATAPLYVLAAPAAAAQRGSRGTLGLRLSCTPDAATSAPDRSKLYLSFGSGGGALSGVYTSTEAYGGARLWRGAVAADGGSGLGVFNLV
jgi:hypothetical protein